MIIKPIGKAAIIETVCKFAIEFLENNKAKAEDIYKQLREQKIKKIGISGKVEITYEYYN